MYFNNDITKQFFINLGINACESINDLRDKEFSGKTLTDEEKHALTNFDNKYRIAILSNEEDETKFHLLYRQIQVISNLGDWREFLNDQYTK